MQNSVAKKIFAIGVAASTVLMGLAPFAAHAAAHATGTNVLSSDGTVWMIMPDGTRRAYTSGGAFLSYGFNSFASVVIANAEDLALPTGSFIPPQDGKVLCSDRGADKGTCYVITSALKAGFTSAAVFTGLGFSFSRAAFADVSWMASTSNIDNTTAAHRAGVLVNNNGTVQLVGISGLLGIPDLSTFNSWGYSFADVVPANNADKAMTQTGVMATRVAGQLSPTALTSVTPVISGSVAVSLASDTPPAQTIAVNGVAAASSTVVTLAKFTFTGSGSVTQMQVKRTGVSPDTIINNSYLYNGGTRLTDAASVGGSSTITFNNPGGLFTVNGTMTISVVAEIAGNSAAGQTVALQLVGFTVANGTPATVAIAANTFTIAVASDLAYASFGAVTPSGSSFDPSTDLEVFRSNVTVNTRDMTLSRFIVRNIGSALASDIVNFRLRVDGTQVAQMQTMDGSGYVYFTFNPVTLKSGTRVVNILADVIGGSSRNFQFQIRNKADVNFTDTQYNTSVSPSNTFPVGSASSNSINSGSLTIQKAANSPSGNVTTQSSDVTLAKFTITAYGEAMKIETLQIGATSSRLAVGSLRNGRLLINGSQYGSTATLASTTNNTYTTGGTQFTINYTVSPGTPATLEIHADMFDNDGSNSLVNNDTVTVYVMAVSGANNVQRLTSLGYITAPSSSVAANAISNVSGSMTLTKNSNYGNQSTPLPQTNYKLGSYNLVGSTSEDITISSIDLTVAASSSLFNWGGLNNIQAKVNGNNFGTVKSTMSSGTATLSGTSTFSSSFTLVKGATAMVEIWGDLTSASSSNITSNEFIRSQVFVNGTTLNSSASVGSGDTGQNINYGNASLTLAQDPSTSIAALLGSNQTKTVAAFKVTTANDSFRVTEINITLASSTVVTSLVLKAGGDALNSNGDTSVTMPGGTSSIGFTNLNWTVAANTTKIFTFDAVIGNVGVGAGNSSDNVKVTIASTKYAPSSTGVITTDSSQVPAGNNQYVYKAIPTITMTQSMLPSTALVIGVNTLAKFQLSTSGGTVGWAHVVFNVSTSTGITVTSPQLWDADSNTQITASAAVDNVTGKLVVDTASEQQVSGGKNYYIKGTVNKSAGLSSGDYVSLSIPNSSASHAVPATAPNATTTGQSVSFVWSDLSAQSHSFTTVDWNNDNLVKNLPTDSQTLTK